MFSTFDKHNMKDEKMCAAHVYDEQQFRDEMRKLLRGVFRLELFVIMNPQVPISHSSHFESLRMALAFDDIIYINGLPSNGKTSLAKVLLRELGKNYLTAYIDCHFAINQSKLYLDILSNFDNKNGGNGAKKGKSQRQIMGVVDFEKSCQEYKKLKKKEKILITFDHVEQLRKTAIMESLVVLATMNDIHLILIAHDSSTNLLDFIRHTQPRVKLLDRLNIIRIPPFSESETEDFITAFSPNRGKELYKNFVGNTVKLVYPTNTKDFREIKTFCQDSFEKFLEHYNLRVTDYHNRYNKNKELPENFTGSALTTFFMSFKGMLRHKDMMSWQNDDLDTLVCYGTSLVIFAAYLAAHTRPSADKINFVKYQKRLAKRRADMKDHDKSVREFTLERLLQIAKGLNDLTKEATIDDEQEDAYDYLDTVLRDVDLLENLGIIRATVGNELDLHRRYKLCGIVPQTFFERIARKIELPLLQIYGLPLTNETRTFLIRPSSK